MLEYLPWKKKRPQEHTEVQGQIPILANKGKNAGGTTEEAAPKPVLSHHDEEFIKKSLEGTDEQPAVILEGSGTATPDASPRVRVTPLETPVPETLPAETAAAKRKREKEEKAAEWKGEIRSRWEGLRRSASGAVDKRKGKGKGKGKEEVEDKEEVKKEAKSEEDELRSALDGLSLAAKNGRAFPLSPATAQLLDRFTQILKDLVNGVPTAYNDLVELLESSSKMLEETFKSLPSFLQKIIKTLPKKMEVNLAPEVLQAVAATAPAAATEVEKLSSNPTLKEIVTKPGLLMGMLKSVINLLKTRFPMALGGANLAISMGLFVVLFVLWYCHKRGREERIERERLEAKAAAAEEEGSATGAAMPTMVAEGEEKEK